MASLQRVLVSFLAGSSLGGFTYYTLQQNTWKAYESTAQLVATKTALVRDLNKQLEARVEALETRVRAL